MNCELDNSVLKEFIEKSKVERDLFYDELGETHINPLKTLEELEKWAPKDPFNIATIPLKKFIRNQVIFFFI